VEVQWCFARSERVHLPGLARVNRLPATVEARAYGATTAARTSVEASPPSPSSSTARCSLRSYRCTGPRNSRSASRARTAKRASPVSKEWPTELAKSDVIHCACARRSRPLSPVSARFVPRSRKPGKAGTVLDAEHRPPTSVKMGVEHASGWRAINDFSNTRSLTPASWRVAGRAAGDHQPHIDVCPSTTRGNTSCVCRRL